MGGTWISEFGMRANARKTGGPFGRHRRAVSVAIAVLSLIGVAQGALRPAAALTSDYVATVNFSVDCTSGLGVGVAFDGTNLWYSCLEYVAEDTGPDLYRASPLTGAVSASYNLIVGGGLGALSYDATRNAIWAGEGPAAGWTEEPKGATDGPIYKIQLDAHKNVVGTSIEFFTGDFCGLDDGLAFDARDVGDPADDVLYYSDDCYTTVIDVYPITGGPPIESFPWGGESGGNPDCYNSGLAVGGQLLYEGGAGCGHVWVVDKETKLSAFDFSTIVPGDPNFRDEDLECDTDTFAVDVMWSKEASNPMRAHAFEIPAGSCGGGGVPGDPPVVTITNPPSGEVLAVAEPVTFAGTFADDVGDTHTAEWTFGSTTIPGTVMEGEGGGTVTDTFAFLAAGVYPVTLTVTDDGGASGTADMVGDLLAFVVVYDPAGGFVTGGGWIPSPPGAFAGDPAATGKASFGFVSKYQKGKTLPTGETEFQFKVADLNFHSTSYDWLVCGGPKCQFKGHGTVNGDDGYSFLLTAIDGQLPGGGGQDKLRMKIWVTLTGQVVYDNQVGADDNADPTTVIGGGSIVIHKG